MNNNTWWRTTYGSCLWLKTRGGPQILITLLKTMGFWDVFGAVFNRKYWN